jgi:hypothetical protein
MREAENFNFSLSNLSEENSSSNNRRLSKKTGFYTQDSPNLEDIIRFIKNKNLSPEIEASLIAKANKTPHGSLANFRENYKIYINK